MNGLLSSLPLLPRGLYAPTRYRPPPGAHAHASVATHRRTYGEWLPPVSPGTSRNVASASAAAGAPSAQSTLTCPAGITDGQHVAPAGRLRRGISNTDRCPYGTKSPSPPRRHLCGSSADSVCSVPPTRYGVGR